MLMPFLALLLAGPPEPEPTITLGASPVSATDEPPEAAEAPASEDVDGSGDPDDDPDREAAPATELAQVEAEHETAEDGPALELQPPAPDPQGTFATRRRRSPVWGQVWLTGTIIANPSAIGLGGSGVRFVVPRLGFGLDVEDIVVIAHGAYNLFQATPKVVFLLLPNLRVTPIASAGFGGAFFSHGGGVYGRWVVGAGVMFAIREHLRFGFGLDVDGLTPTSRFYRRFTCDNGGRSCHIGPSPWVSFGWRA